jgi:hypothetical protein
MGLHLRIDLCINGHILRAWISNKLRFAGITNWKFATLGRKEVLPEEETADSDTSKKRNEANA